MTQFTIEPIYGSLWVFLFAVAAIVSVIAWVTPPTEDPNRRRVLVALRSAAALVLLIAAMRPALVRTDNRPAPATLVIAADLSKSMTLPDGDNSQRWTTQAEAVQELAAGLRSLDETLNIKLLGYDGRSQLLADASDSESIASLGQVLQQMEPQGVATDLGVALRGAIESTSGQPLAGVVLIGDGTQNVVSDDPARPPTDNAVARQGAEVLNSLGVPLWSLPTGPPGGDESTRDVAISTLNDSFQLFAGNQFDVGFTIEMRGLASQQIPVTVSWIDQEGNKTEARSRQIDSRSAVETRAINIPMTAPDPGVYRLEVRAADQRGEWVTSNNSQVAFVEVREGGGRILVLGGPGRPEKTFLMRSLRRFPDLELDDVTVRGRQRWPVDLEAALVGRRYDIFVLGDLDASAIGSAQLSRIAERVAEGAGLVMLGGYQTYEVGGYADGPLAKVLPIRMDATRRRQPVRGVMTPAEVDARKESQLPGPVPMTILRNHPIVDLGGGDPAGTWASLPPAPGANRFEGAKIAAGVQVLLQSPDQHPLMVIGSYGKGRVATLALDSTYRWWRVGKINEHRRFWRQLMLWLMSREETTGDSVIAELDLRRFETDAQPQFRAKLQTITEERPGVTLSAKVVDADGNETAMGVTAEAGDTPSIRGTMPELSPGFYKLVASADDETIQPDEVAFQVTEANRELARPIADPVYLKQLADLTASHGGAAFDPKDVAPLIDTIAERRRAAETPVIDKQRLGDGPLSGWIVFVLFAGTLSCEWFLRRRWGMA